MDFICYEQGHFFVVGCGGEEEITIVRLVSAKSTIHFHKFTMAKRLGRYILLLSSDSSRSFSANQQKISSRSQTPCRWANGSKETRPGIEPGIF